MTSSPADAPDLNAILGSGTGDELTPEQLAALARLDDGPFGCDEDDDPNGAGFGPDTRPPDGWDLMTPAAQQALLGAPLADAVPETIDAGFTHRDGGSGLGFAAGGPLDRMAPGGMLTMFTERAWEDGLERLSDDELVGVMTAARRGASRQAALELATIAELSVAAFRSRWPSRRARRGGGRGGADADRPGCGRPGGGG